MLLIYLCSSNTNDCNAYKFIIMLQLWLTCPSTCGVPLYCQVSRCGSASRAEPSQDTSSACRKVEEWQTDRMISRTSLPSSSAPT